MHSTLDDDLNFAFMLAAVGERIGMERQCTSGVRVDTKPDGTPVSNVDREVEHALVAVIHEHFPDDGWLGEELGSREGAGRRWIIDPIDGTINFIDGRPQWAVQVALEVAGHIQVGVVAAPLLGQRWWASRGAGAYRNGRRLQVKPAAPLHRSVITARAARHAAAHDLTDHLSGCLAGAAAVDGDASFWPELLVAEGIADIDACPSAKPWDLAPRQLIVEEAGGCFTDLTGERRCDGGSSLCCTGPALGQMLADGPGPLVAIAS